jgi:hypothetical protein
MVEAAPTNAEKDPGSLGYARDDTKKGPTAKEKRPLPLRLM